MDIALLIINLILAVVGVVSAVAAVVQARSAREERREAQQAQRDADTARREAQEYAAKAAAAFERQASAQEEANQIQREVQRPRAALRLTRTGGQNWTLTNSGSATIYRADVTKAPGHEATMVDVLDPGPRDLGPGDSFSIVAVLGMAGTRPRIQLTGEDLSGGTAAGVQQEFNLS